jgi:hypothetical protein
MKDETKTVERTGYDEFGQPTPRYDTISTGRRVFDTQEATKDAKEVYAAI